MTDDAPDEAALDWSSASVDDGRLTVAVVGDVPRGWVKRVEHISERLQKTGSSWGRLKVTKTQVQVDDVTADAAPDLHHFLESVVLQANTDLRDDSGGDDAARSEEDERLTEAFRSLGS
jgi:hypothetical protein